MSHRTGSGPAVVLHSEVDCVSFSPQQKLSRGLDRLFRLVQWTSAGRKQLQQDYQCSLEQVDRLTAQLDQGRGVIRDLEAQVTRGQDQVALLEAQLDRGGRQQDKLETLVVRRHRAQPVSKKVDQQNQVSSHKVQTRTWSCPVKSTVICRRLNKKISLWLQPIITLHFHWSVN